MSTLKITMGVQVLDFGPLTRGDISVRFNDGNQNYDLKLTLVTGIASTFQFQEVAYVDGNGGEDTEQALNFRDSWNRDFGTFGGPGKNLGATVDANGDVVITAIIGTFDQANCTYTGNVLTGVTFTVNNTNQASIPLLSPVLEGTGSCSVINYTLTASGGTGPYSVTLNGNTILSLWDGLASVHGFPRGTLAGLVLTDSLAATNTRLINVPRALTPGEFTISRIQFLNSVDLTVEWTTPVAGVTPLQYSLDAQGAGTGTAYQTSPSFTGILPGTYELFIKDLYGCEVQKTIIVSSASDPSMEPPPPYFEVMHGNGVLFSESTLYDKWTKKNFENTHSYNEATPVAYATKQYFDPSDEIAVQFKSSYPFHVVTLLTCDGVKTDIPPVTVQQNMGVEEKVDCMIFPIPNNGGTGVYFDGGNEYAPDTVTIIGASEHTTFLPYWVAEGQIVSLDGLGVFTIQATAYDVDRQKDYFIINTTIAAEVADKVQVAYNKQIYNLFEFRFSIPSGKKGRIAIEKGEDFNNIIGNPWTSELLIAREDRMNDLLIQWSDRKNRGGIVFQSNIQFLKRIEGQFIPGMRGEAEATDTDSRTYSLSQSAYQEYTLELEGLSAKEAYQMCIASGLSDFRVNGIPCVRPDFPAIERLGQSNLYNFSVQLRTGADDLAIQKDEIVLDVSTGVEGGGAGAYEPYTLPLYDNRIRLKTTGGFVTVSGDYIAIE